MYRSDLEAAQARAEALEREAAEAKERAAAAEAEAARLRTRNTELEERVRKQGASKAKVLARAIQRAKPTDEDGEARPPLTRLAWFGLGMVVVGAIFLFFTWLFDLGEVCRAISAGLVVVGIFLD